MSAPLLADLLHVCVFFYTPTLLFALCTFTVQAPHKFSAAFSDAAWSAVLENTWWGLHKVVDFCSAPVPCCVLVVFS